LPLSARGRDGDGAKLFVVDVLHPLDRLALESFLNGDMAHCCAGTRAMPVLFAWWKPHDVASAYLLDRAARALRAPRASSHDQCLADLPADEIAAIDRHLRELDRLAEDLDLLDCEIAQSGLEDPSMTRKWGSCSMSGTITLALDLDEQSEAFQDFVVAHELLHLKVQNHGRVFRALMNHHVPDWRRHAVQKGQRKPVTRES
jgi:hypothetical protein